MRFENPGMKEILANWQWTGLLNSDGWEAKLSASILVFLILLPAVLCIHGLILALVL